MAEDRTSSRWQRRSAGARALRWAVLCAPVGASVAAAWAVHGQLPAVRGTGDRLWQLLVLGLVSTVVVVLVDRLARRLLPLVTLLDLSMLFPDRAPSRLAVARAAIRQRPIDEQLARVRDAGADPGAVAREILTLVAAMSAHDRPTRGHAERVRMFTDLLAEQLKVPRRDRDLLRWAAILHDIGKLQVPATLLNKPGKPTEQEWVVLKAHPAHGAEMAAGLLPWLGEWSDVIVQHHERYDGTGYPTGLSGSQIGLGARIVSVADAYDVMTAARAYKRPVSRAAALRELVRFSGTQFDPTVVRAMVAVGAPRLRRTQGLIAWLADLPLVASSAVPAATVARVVGASALATGAVASGPAALGLPTDPAAGAGGALRRGEPGRRLAGRPGHGHRQPAARVGLGRPVLDLGLRPGQYDGHRPLCRAPADARGSGRHRHQPVGRLGTHAGPGTAQRLAGTHSGTDADVAIVAEALADADDLDDRHPHRHGQRRGHRPGRHGRRGAPGPGGHGHRHGRHRDRHGRHRDGHGDRDGRRTAGRRLRIDQPEQRSGVDQPQQRPGVDQLRLRQLGVGQWRAARRPARPLNKIHWTLPHQTRRRSGASASTLGLGGAGGVGQPQTAPWAAEPTSFTYFASTPVV
jgi:putative nucleotidyltransferase with HDIG domain